MSESQRTSIASVALKLDGEFKPVALTGLGAAMSHLNESQRDDNVTAARVSNRALGWVLKVLIMQESRAQV